MKKQLVFLLVIFGLAVSGYAQNAGPDNENPNPENGFGLKLNMLPPAQLQALVVHAQEKIQDFFDYLSLASNPELDSEMRKQSGKLAQDMFTGLQAPVKIQPEFKDFAQGTTIEQLVKNALQNKGKAWAFQGFQSQKPVKSANPDDESATSAYSMQGTLSGGKIKTEKPASVTVITEIVQVKKQFGNRKEMVWEVFFSKLMLESK